MQINKNYCKNGFLIIIGFLVLFINHPALGPIFVPFGITYVTFYNFKSKKEVSRNFYSSIMALTLVLMFILEYFLVPIQNTPFYVLLIILSVSWFLAFYSSFNYTHEKEKIIVWTGMILFAVSFSMLFGVVSNDFMLALIMGVFVLIIFSYAFFVRNRRFGKAF